MCETAAKCCVYYPVNSEFHSKVSFYVCDAASSWPSYVHANDKSIRVRDYPPLDATKQTQWDPLGILAGVPKE